MIFPAKKLFRSPNNRMIAGVCGGIGEYFDVDPVLVRVVFLLVSVLSHFGPAIILYVLLVLVIPEEGSAQRVPQQQVPRDVTDTPGDNIKHAVIRYVRDPRAFVGALLVLFGLLSLLNVYLPAILSWDAVFSVFLIAVGALLLWQRREV